MTQDITCLNCDSIEFTEEHIECTLYNTINPNECYITHTPAYLCKVCDEVLMNSKQMNILRVWVNSLDTNDWNVRINTSTLTLSKTDATQFVNMMESDPEPNEKLKRVFKKCNIFPPE